MLVRNKSSILGFFYLALLTKDVNASQSYNYEKLRLSGTEQFYKGAVAAEHPKCSEIGVQMMELGGSAADAAIASLLCVGVINNFATGIGGGGFMLVRDEHGNSHVIDFRETAPLSANKDMFKNDTTLATDSVWSFAVPGEIRGFSEAHHRFGKLPWSKLFEPAIKLANEGFPVTKKLEEMISKFAEKMKKSPGMVKVYFSLDGTVPKKRGDFIKRPNLARTLQIIAAKGADAFYEGVIAESLEREVKAGTKGKEGGLTLNDLSGYQVKIRDPLISTFAGFKLITAGPPTSGPLIIQILKVAERLHLYGKADDAETMQRIIETFKFAYVDRMKLGDPDFVENIDEIVKTIISDARAAQRVPKIDQDKTHPPKYYFEEDESYSKVESNGTTHLTTMDKSGMTVVVTSTVNLEWGCKVMDDETGIILNNEMDDFSCPNTSNSFGLPESKANYIEPFKRPLSSASPVILERDGKVFLALGAAGGSRIITAVADMIIKLVVFGMDPDDAMDSCRLHHQLLPDVLLAEDRCDRQLLRKLSQFGHRIMILGPNQHSTSVNMIIRNADGSMVPISDGRKGGIGAGY